MIVLRKWETKRSPKFVFFSSKFIFCAQLVVCPDANKHVSAIRSPICRFKVFSFFFLKNNDKQQRTKTHAIKKITKEKKEKETFLINGLIIVFRYIGIFFSDIRRNGNIFVDANYIIPYDGETYRLGKSCRIAASVFADIYTRAESWIVDFERQFLPQVIVSGANFGKRGD